MLGRKSKRDEKLEELERLRSIDEAQRNAAILEERAREQDEEEEA